MLVEAHLEGAVVHEAGEAVGGGEALVVLEELRVEQGGGGVVADALEHELRGERQEVLARACHDQRAQCLVAGHERQDLQAGERQREPGAERRLAVDAAARVGQWHPRLDGGAHEGAGRVELAARPTPRRALSLPGDGRETQLVVALEHRDAREVGLRHLARGVTAASATCCTLRACVNARWPRGSAASRSCRGPFAKARSTSTARTTSLREGGDDRDVGLVEGVAVGAVGDEQAAQVWALEYRHRRRSRSPARGRGSRPGPRPPA